MSNSRSVPRRVRTRKYLNDKDHRLPMEEDAICIKQVQFDQADFASSPGGLPMTPNFSQRSFNSASSDGSSAYIWRYPILNRASEEMDQMVEELGLRSLTPSYPTVAEGTANGMGYPFQDQGSGSLVPLSYPRQGQMAYNNDNRYQIPYTEDLLNVNGGVQPFDERDENEQYEETEGRRYNKMAMSPYHSNYIQELPNSSQNVFAQDDSDNQPLYEQEEGEQQHKEEKAYPQDYSKYIAASRKAGQCSLKDKCHSDGTFRRDADLIRHFQEHHELNDKGVKFYCDYNWCKRQHKPFTRKSHYKEHLRHFHTEALSTGRGSLRKISKSEKQSISTRWWRCSECLKRNDVCDEWDCRREDCNHVCEPERIDMIRRKIETKHRDCNVCGGLGKDQYEGFLSCSACSGK